MYLAIKGKKMLYNHLIELGKHKMDLIYLDVVSLILVKGFNSSNYLTTFTYNYFKLTHIYLIKVKGKVINYFIHFKKHYKRLDLKWVIKRLYNNNKGEYISSKL
jgi:hypothetical protein